MGIAELPTELLDMILDLLVPYDWHRDPIPGYSWFLELRLVCGRFNYSISYQALRKFKLGSGPIWLNFSSIKWLLVTKLQASRGIETGLAAAVWDSVLSIGFWKSHDSEASVEKEYLDSACGLLIANRGTRWACEQLEASSKSRFHLPLSGKEGERLPPSHERALEAMECFQSLHVAAYHGDSSLVQTFLENNMDPNLSNEYFGSALYAACYRGHAYIARLLIEHGANLDDKGFLGTPLEAAAHLGHTTIVRLLLDRGTMFYSDGITNKCLLDASKEGHAQVVQVLLEQNDINANATDDAGRSPLIIAAERQHHGVARLLSARDDAQPNIMDGEGQTALYYACHHGSSDLVRRLLLRKDIDPNLPIGNISPLVEAIREGHNKIVRLLLAHGDVDPNHDMVNTPLGYAIRFNNKDAARLLLERHDIDPNKLDTGMAPLCMAVDWERLEIIRLLLKRTDIDLNNTASHSTPLWCAVDIGNDEIVELLLSQDGIDPSVPPHHGTGIGDFDYEGTLLQRAAQRGYAAILERLLGCSVLDPNENGKKGTPLCRAARHSRVEAMRLLLKRPDVDLNLPSYEYIPTPREISIEDELLKSKRCYNESKGATYNFSMQSARFGKETPLLAAVRAGIKSPIQLLLEQPHIDANFADASGRSPLWWATYYGDDDIVQMLLENPNICPSSKDIKGWAPLLTAVCIGRTGIVELLLKHTGTDPNTANEDGWTPLLIAVNKGHTKTVELLLRHPDINPYLALSDGSTPLTLAQRKGYHWLAAPLKRDQDRPYRCL